jgi:hypothetical protein
LAQAGPAPSSHANANAAATLVDLIVSLFRNVCNVAATTGARPVSDLKSDGWIVAGITEKG